MIEQELHAWHRDHSISRVGLIWNFLSGEPRYWPDSAAVTVEMVERLDEPRECERVALEVWRRFGFPVCFGWAASDAHARPVAHFWNLNPDRGEVVDAASARRKATGYLGVVLEPDEVGFLDRFKSNRSRPQSSLAA